MKMANIGIGVGAFSQGLMNGLTMGRELKKIRNENEIEAIRREGLAQARNERDQKIASSIQEIPAAEGIPAQFRVGDKTFATREEATAAAGKGVESVMDAFMKSVAPRIQEAYLAQGNIEMAEGWRNWSESRVGKDAIADWSRGYFAAQRGDWDKAATSFGKYYSNYVDPDMEYVGHETLKDGNGGITGFTVNLKDRKTGKESALPIGTEEMLQLGMAHNPQALFESLQSQHSAAENARLTDATDQRKHDRAQAGKIEIEREKARLKELGESAKSNRATNALREAGYSDQFIRQALPSLLGVDVSGPYKKGASPEEVARMLLQERLKDIRFQRMTPEQQQQVIAQDMALIQRAAGTALNPATPAGAAATQGVIFDTKTNQFVPIR